MIGFNNTSNVLIVDIYPGKAGATTASNNLSRCLLGAVASAVIVSMINAMGSGWAFTLIGLLYLVFAPVLLLIMKYGIKWRKEIRDKEERRMAAKAEKKSRQQPPHDEVADDTDEPEPSARVEKD